MIAYTDFEILEAVAQQALNANCPCKSLTPLNIFADITMITSLNMQASGLILAALECTKCVFGRGSIYPGPHWGSLQRSPDP